MYRGISVFCRGFLTIAFLLGVFLLDTGISAAQEEETLFEKLFEKTLFEVDFNVSRWNVDEGGNSFIASGWEGWPNLYRRTFEYQGVVYRVDRVYEGGGKVTAVISPPFPPENLPSGVERDDFTLETYVLLSGEGALELNSFKFSAVPEGFTSNEWSGSVGWRTGNNTIYRAARVRITFVDKSLADNLRFAQFRPNPTETSGRLEFVRNVENAGGARWFRVCDNGDNEFGKEEARVACRQLGIETSNAEPIDLTTTGWLTSTTPGVFGVWQDFAQLLSIYTSPALLDNIQCEGNEERLIDCNHLGFGVVSGGSCPVNNTVAVDCAATSSTGNSNSDNNGCICGRAPNGQCWSSQHCGQGGGFGE